MKYEIHSSKNIIYLFISFIVIIAKTAFGMEKHLGSTECIPSCKRLVLWVLEARLVRSTILLLLIKSRDGLRRHSGSRDIIGWRVGSATVTSWLGSPLIIHNLPIWGYNLLTVLLLTPSRCTTFGRSSFSVSLPLGEYHLVVLRIYFTIWRQRPFGFLSAS